MEGEGRGIVSEGRGSDGKWIRSLGFGVEGFVVWIVVKGLRFGRNVVPFTGGGGG